MASLNIATIPGDGTGPEVTAEGIKVLQAAAAKFEFELKTTEYDLGGRRYHRTGETCSRLVMKLLVIIEEM